MNTQKVFLSHGSGGTKTHELIKDLVLGNFDNPVLRELSDSAVLEYKEKVAFTTDSFVVSPLFFPGADIGKLAVCGTVNDLVMQGAEPQYLSLALILEEGLDYGILEKIVWSIRMQAKDCGVKIVTGDIKVVQRGACDKIFINTSGVGRIIRNKKLSVKDIGLGDKIILTGDIGRHGFAVLSARKGLELGLGIKSDCAALNNLLVPVLKKTDAVKFMRDPTRGGLATTLNEIALSSGLGVIIDEKSIPVSGKVKAASELLGIDPLYAANEGRAVLVVKDKHCGEIMGLLKNNPLGRLSRVMGEVSGMHKGKVILNTAVGTQRIVDMLSSDPLPRIC